MSTEFNELLPLSSGDRPQIWIIGTRDQVNHLINEMTVKHLVRDPLRVSRRDRIHFSPIIPAPFATGKYMAVVTR